ncbi:MAG: hypothetical protein ACREDN_06715 [Aestuariivirga sp.]
MLEEILTTIQSLVPTGASGASLPPEALPIPYLCSALGALILGRYTGNFGNLTMPLNYSALFIGAMLSTWALRGIDLPVDHAIYQPLLVSMVGMLGGAFAMMWWLRQDNLHAL